MAKAFLDPPHSTRRSRDRRSRSTNVRRGSNVGREGTEFYDVTAWSLPVASESRRTGPRMRLRSAALACDLRRVATADGRPRRVGGERCRWQSRQASSADGRRSRPISSPRNATGVATRVPSPARTTVAVSTTPVEAGGRRWPRGTYIVRVARNDTTVHARLDALARESGVEVVGVNSAATSSRSSVWGRRTWSRSPPHASRSSGTTESARPRMAAIWWTLEQRYGWRSRRSSRCTRAATCRATT